MSFIIGDPLSNAPPLAARGPFKAGVRTLTVTRRDALDVLRADGPDAPRYDRRLTVEVWYPATLAEGEAEHVVYEQVMGVANDPQRPLLPFTYAGRAARDAAPDRSGAPYPLVVVAHGYPGSRLMFTYLTENLASKGYVVVSIDHLESTYRDVDNFASTLLHRAPDSLFVLAEMAAADGAAGFLRGVVDGARAGLVGYSMGGYGVLNAAGAGFSEAAVTLFATLTSGSTALAERQAGHAAYLATHDERVRAVVALAPWGMEQGAWDAAGLAGLTVPTLFIAGADDEVSGYGRGVRAIFDGAINADRTLLTYLGARHNIAPNPPVPALRADGVHPDEYWRYAEPAWDERRINNINQHFITAFLDRYLKGVPRAAALGDDPWRGFDAATAARLELVHRAS